MANKNNNPKDASWPLFKKLTRLFSGPIINYRSQSTRQLSRRRLDKYGTRFKDVAGQNFQRLSYNPFDNLSANIMSQQNRTQRYVDFDQMEYTPEIASALDIYADEMTTSNNLNKMLDINCPNEEIKSILDTLYYNVLNLEFNMFGWARTMCKYGDFFLYLDLNPEVGIVNAIGLPTPEVERLEGEDKTNANYVQYQWNTGGLTFENWQMAHFRILGNDKYAPYGTSTLEPCRRIWRQLTLLEDAMMAYRIVRSPERRVFYVDVGNINPQDVEQYMQKVITSMKRNQVIDPDTGRVDLRYNPMSVDEDYFIPVRAGQKTEIQSLPGGTYTGDIDDVKYLRDKLFSALKIPQSYLSRGEGTEEDKSTLAQKDIRFARTVQRLQRSIISELEKIGVVHLYTLGFRGDDLVSFKLTLNNPSKLAEMQELEHWRMKFDTGASATEGYFSQRWVAKNIFSLSDEEIVRNQREIFTDLKRAKALETIEQAQMAQMAGAAQQAGGELGLGGPGEVPPGEEPAPEAEAGDEAAEETPEEEKAEGEEEGEGGEGEEESALPVTPPGKRDEEDWYKLKKKGVPGQPDSTTTSKSKGKWYKPVTYDKRDMGARRRHYKGQWASEVASATDRNLFKGAMELYGLGKNAIYEDKNTIYDNEEKKLLEMNKQIKDLIEELESKDATET